MTSDWKVCKLKDLCIDNKGSYGIAASAVEYSEKLYTYLRISDITDVGTLSKSDLKSVADADADKYLLQPNDIVFARTGGSTGRNYFYDGSDGPLVYAGFLIKFSINPSIINPKYVKYYCQSQTYKNWVNSFNTGSTRGNINAQTYGNMDILVPPRRQQDLLVSVLGAIDDKIELNNSINKNLEQQIKSIYSNGFNKSSNLIDISDLIDVRDGTHDSPKPQKEGKKLITSKHLLKYGVDISYANLISETDYEKINERSRVETNDILISMIGTVGIVSYIIENPVDFAVKNVGIYRTSQKPEYSYYIHCYLNSTETQNYILSHLAGTTQKYISLSELRTLKVNIPNQSELENFNKLVKPMYDNIINLTKENERLTQLRDTLLPKLMNGEIDVDKIIVPFSKNEV